ncbi:LOW QUALITY PROTEIN: SWI/SNF-related matrix-associated actin-dependent regulator of chromatin subfamily A-like protein 1 [Centruroides vittatus]|uniref:LOW QUALITY PROTEIN: SWI/SNF-related matrix-associated actin-dependent regulator of chromatin subfamily A-like protein 1 n=1 Tax=Centruroides vittatus TaxID=120091 RepID=UPI0035100031
MTSTVTLSEEQKRRIEENRRKALEIRAAKLQKQQLNFYSSKSDDSRLPSKKIFSNKTYSNNKNVSTSNWNRNNNKLYKKANFPTSDKQITGTCVLVSRSRFMVEIGYHSKLIEVFRTIPSKLYDAKEKKWTFSIKDHNTLIKATKTLFPEVVIKPLPKTVVKVFSKDEDPEIKLSQDLSVLDSTLLESLMPFQKQGVSFGISLEGRVLIADDMGLGKTIQAIAIARYYKEDWPLLVVAPSSVRYTWVEAFLNWLPFLKRSNITVVNTGKDEIGNNKILITSYDLLKRRASEFLLKRFQIVIMDECHFLKNIKAARTVAAKPIMQQCKRLIMLSGTPALSRPIELYSQISAINPEIFPRYHEFGLRYCGAKKMPWGWNYDGSSNMNELQLLLEETVMIRRLKSNVISQLPPKSRQMILLDPHSIRIRKKFFESMSTDLCRKELKAMERRGILLEYFKETSHSKLSAVCDYIKDLLEGGKKFVCFAHHKTMLDGICEAVESTNSKYIRIDGSTKSEDRKDCCDIFQFNDECRVAVLSITAANAGISLTSAHLVVFAELFWNPGILTQAEDRVHRIGQEDSVVIQYLVAQGTADDHIWPLVQRKLNTLNKVGLSKDNFFDADMKRARDPFQPVIYQFMEDTSGDEEFWTQVMKDEDAKLKDKLGTEPTTKKSKVHTLHDMFSM